MNWRLYKEIKDIGSCTPKTYYSNDVILKLCR